MAHVKYQTIVADPPWPYPEGFATQSRSQGRWTGLKRLKPLPYDSMELDAIAGLPVSEMTGADCRLFLWTTNRYLPAAFAVMSAWGFTYRQALVWHKRDGNMGGSVAPNSAEFLLVGVMGHPRRLEKMKSSVVTTAAPKKHSRKPECFLDSIEKVSPGPYLEMFARRQRIGWDSWGNECRNDVELSA